MKTTPNSRISPVPVLRGARRAGKRGGYALVTVIWGLGIITLLIVSFMTTARLRLQAANNIAGAGQADEIAQAAINLGILSLVKEKQAVSQPAQRAAGQVPPTAQPAQPQRVIHAGEPKFCSLGAAAVALAIEDEGGKIDLNAANDALIKAMLTGFGVAMRDADAAANAIIAYRTPQNATASGGGPNLLERGAPRARQELLQTVFELDQIDGLESSLVRDMLPFVTVHARRPRVDAETAPPALFAALAGANLKDVEALRATPFPNDLDRTDPRFPLAFKQNGDTGIFLIHAESRLEMGQTSIREAIVDVNGDNGSLFAIRETRRGSARFLDLLRAAQAARGGVGSPC
jgi:general secretion pathway protein K